MKAIIPLYGLILLFSPAIRAQETNASGNYARESIQNSQIGWMKMLQFNEPAKPYAQNGWNYTVKQMEAMRQIATWLQQTFTPRGLLGEVRMSLLAPPPSEPATSKYYTFNEAEKNNRNALPNTYGAFAKCYFLLKKTDTKKFWPQGDYSFSWYIMINNLELITKQMVALSSPDEFYFTMPGYSSGIKGEFDKEWLEKDARYRNFSDAPNLKPYQHYLLPPKIADYGNQPYYVVILTKDQQPLPFKQITVGELISRLEKQLPVMYSIAINNGTRVENLLDRAKKGLQTLKEKFSNNLNDQVYIDNPATQIDILRLAEIEPGKNIYWLKTQAITKENSGYSSTAFPLLTIRKGVKEACATGQPQWIVCRLEKGTEPNNAGEIDLMDNFVSRFNYQYLYNYFLGKEKPAQPYTALDK